MFKRIPTFQLEVKKQEKIIPGITSVKRETFHWPLPFTIKMNKWL